LNTPVPSVRYSWFLSQDTLAVDLVQSTSNGCRHTSPKAVIPQLTVNNAGEHVCQTSVDLESQHTSIVSQSVRVEQEKTAHRPTKALQAIRRNARRRRKTQSGARNDRYPVRDINTLGMSMILPSHLLSISRYCLYETYTTRCSGIRESKNQQESSLGQYSMLRY